MGETNEATPEYASCMGVLPEGAEQRQTHPSITDGVKSGPACRHTETGSIECPAQF